MTQVHEGYEVVRVTYPELAAVPGPVRKLADKIDNSSKDVVNAFGLRNQATFGRKKGRFTGTPASLQARHATGDNRGNGKQTEVAALYDKQGLYLDVQQGNPPGFRFTKLETFDVEDARACLRAKTLGSNVLHEVGELTFGFRLYTPTGDQSPSSCPLELMVPSNEPQTRQLSEMPENMSRFINRASEALELLSALKP